ncbi:MAG: hypothetical protein KC917_06405 [Candidatus Omnitrophica bacterium]|nr:hypothetical protein [Candidatus Omnitrophota bacterium]
MDAFFPFFFIIGIIAVIAGLAIFGYLQEKKRREAFQRLAADLGFAYRAGKDYGIPTRYNFLNKLSTGSNRYAQNILEGELEGFLLHCFDYHYETYSTDSKGRRQTHHHRFSYFILEMRKSFPELLIYPEGFFSKVGQFIGFDDIDFESIEFSKAFVVKSKDKKFAYDICHTRMMEYLLKHPDLSLEIEGPCLAMGFGSRLTPEEVEKRLKQMVTLRKLLPEYLFRD